MTIDNMFNAAKAGDLARDAYKVGEISKKTGLQKQPDGSWKKPGEKGKTKNVAAELTARNESLKKAENESMNNATFEDLNEKAKTEGLEYKIRQMKNGEIYWDKYRDGKHVGGGSATSKTDAINKANKNFEDYIKENKPAPKRESVSSRRMEKDLDGNFWSRPEDFKEDITSRGWDVEEMNGKYAVISNEAGSQYEVRFDDHSDDGDLTVKTFKPLRIDEDDEESDDAGLQGIFESLKK